MARRYSQIKRGAEYNAALDNYVAYIRNAETRPTKRLRGGVRGQRRQTLPAALRPFGMELPAGDFIATRVSQDSLTGLGTALANRLFTQGAQLAGGTKIEGFKPARVVAFSGTGAANYAQSKITKLYYLKYTGDSFSAPFGATTDAEEEAVGARAVKTAVITQFGGADIKRVSFQAEKVPV